MNSIIADILLRKIYDSRGKQTVEARVVTKDGKSEIAMAPSGTSTSKYEAVAFPSDSVELGIKNFIAKKGKFIGMDVREQEKIDRLLHKIDGTGNFSRIGGNIATAISIAVARSAASHEGMELYHYINEAFAKDFAKEKMPRLLGNIVGGGIHSKSKMKIQEILVSPNSGSIERDASLNIEMRTELSKGLGINCSNIEGALVTGYNEEKNLELVSKLVERYEAKEHTIIDIGVDMAASEYYSMKDEKYSFPHPMEKSRYFEAVLGLAEKFGIKYIEDPFDASDFDYFGELSKNLNSVLVVGDDLYATSRERLLKGIKKKSSNGILIKINQVGTLTDTLDTVRLAKSNGIACIVSHRSGETGDTFISHLAVAIGAEFIKCGIFGWERVAKINELLRIENLMMNK
ncbi:MAG: phosphopyruvate hydratase [Candidatus Micrarchaeia archaeon]